MSRSERLIPQASYFSSLESLRNLHGDVICSREESQKLWELGAHLSDLQKLFRLQSKQKYERFFAGTVVFLLEQGGYSTRDLITVADLVDHAGQPILQSSNEFYTFMNAHGALEDAQKFAAIRDSEGSTIYRHDEQQWYLGFVGFEKIGEALQMGIKPERVKELVDIKDDNGISVFRSPRDIHRFLQNGGTSAYVTDLIALHDHEGEQIFTEYSIALLKEFGAQKEDIQRLVSLRDTDGQVVFSDGDDMVNFFRRYTHPLARRGNGPTEYEVIEEVINLKNTAGESIFRDGSDIIQALRASSDDIDKIRSYTAITVSGKTYFTGEDIALLLSKEVPVEYAARLAAKGLNATTIMYNYHLGLGEDEINFSHSGKPKALMIYPTDDPPDWFGFKAFSHKDNINFLRGFLNEYDIKVRAVSSAEEVFAELDNAEDSYYVIFGGHGDQGAIRYGRSNPKYKRYVDEASASLTTNHTELRKHLANHTSLEYILLDSCLTGEGGEGAENMVNFIADCAPGVEVSGATDLVSAINTKVQSWYPPDVHLYSISTYQDCTYRRRVDLN